MSEKGSDHPIQFLAVVQGGGQGAINVLVLFQTLRCELKGPGKDQGGKDTNDQYHDYDSGRSIVKTEQRKYGLGYLDEQPCGHQVCGTYPEYIAAFQLIE